MIDWNSVISNLKDGSVVTVDPARWRMSNPEYSKMLDLWKSKNFNTDSVKWTNYYDYENIEPIVANSLDIKPIRSWISCVEPGYMTGYHYDIDDKETEYLKHGDIKRYSIFISEPDVGHLFILGKDYHFNKSVGTTLKWDNYREWHNGINGGLSNKYMFHILGY
jgi:hypothetical protein